MDSDNKKILTMSYLIVSAVVAYSLGKLMEALSSLVPGMSAYTSLDYVQHGVPVLVGLVTFAVLQFNKRINEYFDEVVSEIRKIVWPSRRDTSAMTVVVCVIVVFAGFMLALFDGVSGYIIGQLAKISLP